MHTEKSRSLACAWALMLVMLAGPSWAGGLYLSEYGSPSMGVAGAGAQAVAADASAAWHNPAGMTRLDSNQLMVTGGFLYGTVKFDAAANTPVAGGDGGDAGGPAPILSAFYAHRVTDRLSLGASLISITGAVLDYDAGWAGRFLNTEVELLSVTFNPTIAYRITDRLSVGAGPMIMYGKLDMKLAVPTPPLAADGEAEIDGDDLAFGFTAGTLFELTERTRFGVAYQSKIDLEFSGDVTINPIGATAGTDTSFTIPQAVRTSVYHELNDQFALLASVDWEDWSDLDNISLSTGAGGGTIPRNWKDTWKFAGGVHYRPTTPWLLQLGFAYDTSPVESGNRTPDMPLDRQIRIATGAQYQWSEKLSVGGQFVYADYGKAKINNASPVNGLIGEYDRNDIFFFALNANMKF